MAEYTDRHVVVSAIKSIEDGAVHRADNYVFGVPDDVIGQLEVGLEYGFETQGFSKITGLVNPRTGYWYFRKSDEELKREHEEFKANLRRDREERWAANKKDWAAREAKLSSPLRRRLERFRANGGHEFDTSGWGYELIVCELAMLYAESAGEDTEDVKAFARKHGTSGNQHDYAKALSRWLLSDDPEHADVVANSVSALSPITGDADYSGAES